MPSIKDIAFNQGLLPNSYNNTKMDEDIHWGVIDGKLIIAYPPTEQTVKDWLFNFEFIPMHGYHGGFLTQALTSVAKVIEILSSSKETEIIFTGYSQGAAVAQVAYDVLRRMRPKLFAGKTVTVQVYASPRCFVWWRALRKRKFTTIYEYGNDLVTKVPFFWMGFKKSGNIIHVGPSRSILIYKIKDHYPQGYISSCP